MSACVTAGSIAPGVQCRSGSWPLSLAWHGPASVPVTRPGSCTSARANTDRCRAEDGDLDGDEDADEEEDGCNSTGAARDDSAAPGEPERLPPAHPARASAAAAARMAGAVPRLPPSKGARPRPAQERVPLRSL